MPIRLIVIRLELVDLSTLELYFMNIELKNIKHAGYAKNAGHGGSTDYYHKRPRESQIAAHISTPQSGMVASREELQQRFWDLHQQVANKEELDKPGFWGGYRLQPDYYEFWQGRPNRLHDRLSYEKIDGALKLQRLMP